MASKIRWADTLDDDEEREIPVGSVTGPDAKGVKTVVEYKKNDRGEVVKVTTRIKTSTIEKRVYKSQLERRKWPRFGDALNEKEGDSVTVRAVEDIPFERVRLQKSTQEEKKTAVDVATALAMGDKSAVGTSLKDMLYRRRMERQLAAARGLGPGGETPPDEDGAPGGTLPTAGAKGGYVPPSVRARATGGGATMGDSMHKREENSVRVTNLSEDTREDDLRELFSAFGPISRIYIAYDRDTGESRGFAFVNFVYRDDANRAIEKLNGFGYDNLILRVEYAAPRTERPGG
jgi:translation initiation factor 3 subunit G